MQSQFCTWQNSVTAQEPPKMYMYCSVPAQETTKHRAKFGWLPLSDVAAVTLPRPETSWDLLGCPELPDRSQPLVGRSSPYCWDMWRILLLNKFVSDCRYMPLLQRYSPTKFCDGAQMANFWRFFASCICSEPRAARFRPASEIRTKATPCVEVWQTSSLRRLRLGGKKEEETTGWKYNGLPYSIGRP